MPLAFTQVDFLVEFAVEDQGFPKQGAPVFYLVIFTKSGMEIKEFWARWGRPDNTPPSGELAVQKVKCTNNREH